MLRARATRCPLTFLLCRALAYKQRVAPTKFSVYERALTKQATKEQLLEILYINMIL